MYAMNWKHVLFIALVGLTTIESSAQKINFSQADLLANKLPKNFLNSLPQVVKWVDDDHVILNQKNHPDSAFKKYLLDIKTGKINDWSEVASSVVVASAKQILVKENDLFYKANGVEKRLTNDKSEEKNPTFSPDSNFVAYTKNNNLYTVNISTGKENQLTTDGNSTTLNGWASWVYFEEIFGRPTKYRAFWWRPDSKQLAFMHFDESMIPMFPIYNSEGSHGFVEETRYPKAGDKNPEVKIGFISPEGGSTVWADFNEKDDQYFGWPVWKPSTSNLLVYWMNRGQDNMKMYDVDPLTGQKKEIYDEKQKTWIDLEDRVSGRVNFINNNSQFIMQSDKTGWNHLYLYGSDGILKNAITTGEFTVTSIKYIDEKNSTVYFTARSRENTARIDLYSVKFTGADFKRLTFGDYNHNVNISPTGKYFITTYSNVFTPARMSLVDNKGKILKELGDARTSELDKYNMAKTELIHIKSADGLFDLPAMVTWPMNMDPNKKYPILVSIYGGPNAGTVMDGWNWSANRQFYAEEGLIQVAFDHRASGHFGKAGVNYMHRNLGYWEMEDYKTMAKWFIANGQADSTKVCITGFSYGGYMSCYALTYGIYMIAIILSASWIRQKKIRRDIKQVVCFLM
jgi:dipeptidyl-peptidase-4